MANSSKSLVYVCVYAYNIVNCQAIFNGRNRCDVIKKSHRIKRFRYAVCSYKEAYLQM